MRKLCWSFGAKRRLLLSVLFCLCCLSISAQLFSKNSNEAKKELWQIEDCFSRTYFEITKNFIPEIGTYPLDDATASQLVAQTPNAVEKALALTQEHSGYQARKMSFQAFKSELKKIWKCSPADFLSKRMTSLPYGRYHGPYSKYADYNKNFQPEMDSVKPLILAFNKKKDGEGDIFTINYIEKLKQTIPTQTPPASYRHMRTDTISRGSSKLVVDTYVKEDNPNDLISRYQRMNSSNGDFYWAVPQTFKDKYTLETTIDLQKDPGKAISCLITTPTQTLSFNKTSEGLFNFLYINKNGLSGYNPSHYITFNGWLVRKDVLNDAIKLISKWYNPQGDRNLTNQKEQFKKEKSDLLSSVFWSGDHNRLYREKMSGEYSCWFDKNEYPKLGFYYDCYNDRYTVVDYQAESMNGRLYFRGDEKIKSVETDNRLLRINMEDGEQLVALKGTESEETDFFSGKLVRRGYTIEFLKYKKKILTFTEGVTQQEGDYEVDIPKGSKFEGSFANFELSDTTAMQTLLSRRTSRGVITTPDGEVLFKFDSEGCHWANMDKYLAQLAAKKKAVKQAIIADYSQRYGRQYVEAAMNGRVVVGMPEKLLREAFTYAVESTSNYSTSYSVCLDAPGYDLENRKIAKSEVHFNFKNSKALVTVVRGKVAGITYY